MEKMAEAKACRKSIGGLQAACFDAVAGRFEACFSTFQKITLGTTDCPKRSPFILHCHVVLALRRVTFCQGPQANFPRHQQHAESKACRKSFGGLAARFVVDLKPAFRSSKRRGRRNKQEASNNKKQEARERKKQTKEESKLQDHCGLTP